MVGHALSSAPNIADSRRFRGLCPSASIAAREATVAVMGRTCARPGCRRSASSTLTYSYRDGVVWVDALAIESHPMTHDMCQMHADGLVVPRGWTCVDRRHSDATSPFSLATSLAV